MGQHEQDDLTTGMTLQMVQLNTLGQLERGHLERGVINVAPYFTQPTSGSPSVHLLFNIYIYKDCPGWLM